MNANTYVLRPKIGPCMASPIQSSFGRAASSARRRRRPRPGRAQPGPAEQALDGRLSGAHPPEHEDPLHLRRCAGFSCLSATASAIISGGVRASWRGEGRAPRTPRPATPGSTDRGRASHPTSNPSVPTSLPGRALVRHSRPRSALLNAGSAASRIKA